MDLAEQVAAVPRWWHSIDLGSGVVTPGRKDPALLASEFAQLQLPALDGLSVLDIGAWDGWFSFECERRGAGRVVALDHYASSGVDRRGIDLAHAARDSCVEVIEADFMTADLNELGQFDIVLFLGVLYHLRHPLMGLERLRQVTRGSAWIESHIHIIGGQPATLAACQFFGPGQLDGDPSNWWAPTVPAITAMSRAAGFANATVLAEPAYIAPPNEIGQGRAVVRADA